MRCLEVKVTTDGSGAAQVESAIPIIGEICEVRCNSTELNNAGKTDVTITRSLDGATVLALTNIEGPWQRAPREPVHTTAGAAALYAAGGEPVLEEIPVAGYLTVKVAEGKAGKTASIFIYYDGGE